MSEKENGWPYVVGDENSNEHHMQDDPEKLPKSGSQERTVVERHLVRKLDTRLLPAIILIYILNYIDVRSLAFNCLIQLLTFLLKNSVVVLRLRG